MSSNVKLICWLSLRSYQDACEVVSLCEAPVDVSQSDWRPAILERNNEVSKIYDASNKMDDSAIGIRYGYRAVSGFQLVWSNESQGYKNNNCIFQS